MFNIPFFSDLVDRFYKKWYMYFDWNRVWNEYRDCTIETDTNLFDPEIDNRSGKQTC